MKRPGSKVIPRNNHGFTVLLTVVALIILAVVGCGIFLASNNRPTKPKPIIERKVELPAGQKVLSVDWEHCQGGIPLFCTTPFASDAKPETVVYYNPASPNERVVFAEH